MNTPNPSIITLLTQQQQRLQALLLLLQQELAALASRDADSLDAICTQKTDLLTELEHSDKQLSALPELATLKQQDWFIDNIAELETLLSACKYQNDVNQQTLEQSQLTLERFKTTLFSSRGKSGLTYTSKGKPSIEGKGTGIKA